MVCSARQDGKAVLFVVLGARRTFADNGWLPEYWGNYEAMADLINTVLAAMRNNPPRFAD